MNAIRLEHINGINITLHIWAVEFRVPVVQQYTLLRSDDDDV